MAQQQVDFEQVIQKFFTSLKNRGGGGGLNPWLVIGVLLLLWIASGFYVISPDEQGVVLRFGKALYTTDPGPHLHLPWPIERVIKPKVTQIKKQEIGFKTRYVGPPAQYVDVPEESLMLTGDENIVDLEFIVQYQIKDPIQYLFKVYDPPEALKDSAESAMRQIVGTKDIDEALTSGKGLIQNEAQQLLQEILDSYEAGIQVVNVKLQDVQPPKEVNDAFKDVINAQQDKERMINEAKGYRNDIIPKARGVAAQTINEAEAYRETLIKNAQGEAERFIALYKEYRVAKQVTKKRLYLESMERVLPKLDKMVVDTEISKKMLPYLPLERAISPQSQPKKGN